MQNRMTFEIPKSLRKKLEALARKEGVSMSVLIRKAIKIFVDVN